MTMTDGLDQWNIVDHLTCDRCRLADYRTQVVPGYGPNDARLAIIGEAPGQVEDTEGRPWVGPAGTVLHQLRRKVGIEDVPTWLTNRVHCRPPRNDLSAFPDALTVCHELWLSGEGGELAALEQLEVIVAMGQTAGALWFPGKKAHQIAEMNTLMPRYDVKTTKTRWIKVVGAYHPSYALRQGQRIEDSIVASLERARSYLQ